MVDIPPVERDLAPQGKLRGGIKCMMSIDDASDQIGSGQGRPLGQQSSYFTLSNGGWFATPEPKYGLGIGEGSPTPDIALLHYRILEPKTFGNPPAFSEQQKWSYAAIASFIAGVMPPSAMLGRSWL